MSIKLDDSRAAAVNTECFWLPVKKFRPPRGVKLLLINRKHGSGTTGDWNPGSEWTHWQGWPKFLPEDLSD